jgi:hypothetical protein
MTVTREKNEAQRIGGGEKVPLGRSQGLSGTAEYNSTR